MAVVAGGDNYDGGRGRRMEAVGLDVHTMDVRPATGNNKRRGSLWQWLEVARRHGGKGDAAAWSSASVSMAIAL